MMGRQHALAGSAAFLALSPALDAAYGVTPGEIALGAFLAAGGAMIPDLDQHGSTIGRTYGPVTNVAARLIAAVSGGHRNGTHSLVGLVAFTAIATAALAAGGWALYALLWLMLGVAARAYDLGIPAHRSITAVIHAVVMAGVTLYVAALGVDLAVPVVGGMVIGVASHIATDMLTPQGCPLLWPVRRTRFGVPLVTTGSRWTSPMVTAVLTAALVVALVAVTPLWALAVQTLA